MTTPDYAKSRMTFWFMGGEAADAQCRLFIPVIRAAGTGKLRGEEWNSRDGQIARLVLLDQFTRNAFRGSPEAFAYDVTAQAVAAEIIQGAGGHPENVPWPAALFVATCLMHSEDLALHERVATFCTAHHAISKNAFLERQIVRDLPEHSAVLRQFGRYPHRNPLYGRVSTAEELAWLASDKAPGWTKSQAVKK